MLPFLSILSKMDNFALSKADFQPQILTLFLASPTRALPLNPTGDFHPQDTKLMPSCTRPCTHYMCMFNITLTLKI